MENLKKKIFKTPSANMKPVVDEMFENLDEDQVMKSFK